ncbi:HNH endonuclease [Rhodoferax sp. WC2427]|uniref:HNH endonuclease n=1 Tax=Rhodoferax sp. WC2427 TaxID=3234144 RepID=UPI003465FFCB
MPQAAAKPCSHPGCGVLVRDGSSRCAKHPRPQWTKKPTATKRITGRKLQAMRADLFRRAPLCVACKALGVVMLATQRDHIIPLAEGGADDQSNEQGLCDACHDAKSLTEASRGRHRAFGG